MVSQLLKTITNYYNGEYCGQPNTLCIEFCGQSIAKWIKKCGQPKKVVQIFANVRKKLYLCVTFQKTPSLRS